MLACWHPDYRRRPKFPSLVRTIRNIIWSMEELAQVSPSAAPLYDNVPTSQSYLYPQKTTYYDDDNNDNDDEDSNARSSASSYSGNNANRRLSSANDERWPLQQQPQRMTSVSSDAEHHDWSLEPAAAAPPPPPPAQAVQIPQQQQQLPMTSRYNRMSSFDSGIAMTWSRSTGADSVFSVDGSLPPPEVTTPLMSSSSSHQYNRSTAHDHGTAPRDVYARGAARAMHPAAAVVDSSRSMML